MKQIEKEFIVAMFVEDIELSKVANICDRLGISFRMVDLTEALHKYIKTTKIKNKIMAKDKWGGFIITSVAKDDLESIGFDTSKVDDATMEQLASKMADAYCVNSFWSDLPIIAKHLKIPKKTIKK